MAFKRGNNPEQVLQLGKHRPFIKGDKLICLANIYKKGLYGWTTNNKGNKHHPYFLKDENCLFLEKFWAVFQEEDIYSIKPQSIWNQPYKNYYFPKEKVDKWFQRL